MLFIESIKTYDKEDWQIEWDSKTRRKFRADYSVKELELKFNKEKNQKTLW